VPKWVWIAYYVIAVWWLIDGGVTILGGFFELSAANDPHANPLFNTHSSFNAYLNFIGGAISLVGGFGLLIKNEQIRNIVTWIAGLRILKGLASLIFGLTATAVFGALGLLLLIFQIIGIFSSALLIYVIGETDKQANV